MSSTGHTPPNATSACPLPFRPQGTHAPACAKRAGGTVPGASLSLGPRLTTSISSVVPSIRMTSPSTASPVKPPYTSTSLRPCAAAVDGSPTPCAPAPCEDEAGATAPAQCAHREKGVGSAADHTISPSSMRAASHSTRPSVPRPPYTTALVGPTMVRLCISRAGGASTPGAAVSVCLAQCLVPGLYTHMSPSAPSYPLPPYSSRAVPARQPVACEWRAGGACPSTPASRHVHVRVSSTLRSLNLNSVRGSWPPNRNTSSPMAVREAPDRGCTATPFSRMGVTRVHSKLPPTVSRTHRSSYVTGARSEPPKTINLVPTATHA
mmetsp:Transcript_35279/g.89277  ORF Transcript_35279/g.89277 Transcript_35279/m.89277 type:complete len:322 (+) Transcript_35279:169-1134(+)